MFCVGGYRIIKTNKYKFEVIVSQCIHYGKNDDTKWATTVGTISVGGGGLQLSVILTPVKILIETINCLKIDCYWNR